MGFFSRYKMVLYVLAGVLIIFVGWWFVTSDNKQEPLLTTEGVGGNGADKGIVDTLLTLRAVSLSGSIFDDPAFASLRDFGTQITAEPVGRENPFAPISFKATTTVKTSLFGKERR